MASAVNVSTDTTTVSVSPAAAILPPDSQKTNNPDQPQSSTSAEMIAGKKVGMSGGNQNEQFKKESTPTQDLMGNPPGTADAGQFKSPRLLQEAQGSATMPLPSPIKEKETSSLDDPLQDDDDIVIVTPPKTTKVVEIITVDDEETSSNDAIPKTIASLPKTKKVRKRKSRRRKPSRMTNVDRGIKTSNSLPTHLQITSDGQLVATTPANKLTVISQESRWNTYEGLCNICRSMNTTLNKCSTCGHLICHQSSCRQNYIRLSSLLDPRKEILCVICRN